MAVPLREVAVGEGADDVARGLDVRDAGLPGRRELEAFLRAVPMAVLLLEGWVGVEGADKRRVVALPVVGTSASIGSLVVF